MCDDIYNLDDGAFFADEVQEEVWVEIVRDEKPARLNVIIILPPYREVPIEEVRRIVKRYWRPQQAQAPPV